MRAKTGAVRPSTFRVSDAPFNLGAAVGVLAASAKPGVYLCMNGRVLDVCTGVARAESTGLFYAKPPARAGPGGGDQAEGRRRVGNEPR